MNASRDDDAVELVQFLTTGVTKNKVIENIA